LDPSRTGTAAVVDMLRLTWDNSGVNLNFRVLISMSGLRAHNLLKQRDRKCSRETLGAARLQEPQSEREMNDWLGICT
jgi:hypothetical protein